MKKLIKPTFDTLTVYTDCVDVFRDAGLKARLLACSNLIIQATEEFEQKITTGDMHTISREMLVNGNVTVAELKNVYNYQMVGHEKGRIYYDALMLSAPLGRCPLCGHHDVTTLDHYLPKALYPRLSVVPINLIPACVDCNKGKLHSYPTNSNEESIHPYYDDLGEEAWLKMRVNRTQPVSVSFSVERVYGWSDLLFARASEHFKDFKLNILYATQSARELVAIKQQLVDNYSKPIDGGAFGVRKLLSENAAGRSAYDKNLWQTAFYIGLAEDDWFCEGGFNRIGI